MAARPIRCIAISSAHKPGIPGHRDDQVEFHQIPGRPRRQACGALCAADQAGRIGRTDTQTAFSVTARSFAARAGAPSDVYERYTSDGATNSRRKRTAVKPPLSRRRSEHPANSRPSARCGSDRRAFDIQRLAQAARHARPRCGPRHRRRCPTPHPAAARG